MSLFPKLQTRATRVFDRALDVTAFTAAALLIFIMLAICFEVVARRIGYPQKWEIEVVEYCLLYVTFLGAAWLLKQEGHVRLDVVVERLSPRVQALLGSITSILSIIISLLLVVYGFQVTWDCFQRGIFRLTPLLAPMWPLIIIIPIGSLFLLVQFVRRTYGYLRAGRSALSRDGDK